MQLSAEVRWFWSDDAPVDLKNWFQFSGLKPGGGESRRDIYFHEKSNCELGVKIRGENPPFGAVEIKGLLAILSARGLPSAATSIQLWCKWRSALVPDRLGFITDKRRWLRKFVAADDVREIALGPNEKTLDGSALPISGCNVELTRVTIEREAKVWWTLGFEAFGDLSEVAAELRKVMVQLQPPVPGGSLELSYPAWIDQVTS
jgi:hypothetical protein